MIRKSLVELAIHLAEKSVCHKQRHGCVIFKNKYILSTGYNQKRYCKDLDSQYKNWIDSLHAEQKAIIFSQYSLKRSSLLVVRLNRNNKLVYSKPCSVCLNLIKKIGISKVFFSNQEGDIEELIMD